MLFADIHEGLSFLIVQLSLSFMLLFAQAIIGSWTFIYKFSILCPAFLGICVPIECQLLDLQHGEGALLIFLVVDVQKDSFKSVVRGRIDELVNCQCEVECFVDSADASVFKPEVDVLDGDSKILLDDLLEPADVGVLLLLRLILVGLLSFTSFSLLGFGLLSSECCQQLVELRLLALVLSLPHEFSIEASWRITDHVDIIQVNLYWFREDLRPGYHDADLAHEPGLNSDRRPDCCAHQ